MRLIKTFMVVPSIPTRLEKLRELAYNLRWAWNHDTIELFRRLDSNLWETCGHNPVRLLGTIDQAKLQAAAVDAGLLAHLDRSYRDLQSYLEGQSTWFQQSYGAFNSPLFAYFSAEFGVTESLSIFAGGLGVLAGDHLKSASDLGVPLVGVGLLYQQGYFQQYLNQAGWQQEAYENNDFHNLPVTLQLNADGNPVTVKVPHPGRQVTAQVWKAQVGRVPLYLLDTNIQENRPDDRNITDQLYGGDSEMRIRQEIVLGIGGFRALQALGISPLVFHLNEGHSAFLTLERIRWYMETQNLSFAEAREVVSAGLVFTTHTPVAAGHDYFTPELIERYFGDYMRSRGVALQDFLSLGRVNPRDDREPFCMTTLALKFATYSNGVSRLHGEVSREMWQKLWPQTPKDEIPITHVTNGVHFQTWVSREMKQLFDRYLGPRWREDLVDNTVWDGVDHISAEELWRTHERRRERLVAYCRRRLQQQLIRRGASQAEIKITEEVLDPDVLTIGFARRFATYKRATLIFRDLDRLEKILNNPERPLQIIFAGKAHPKDDPGKELIKQIIALAHQDRFRRKIVFLEDYDVSVSRYLVQGADVWLNTPLRYLEASGTSGMKAAANGVLNLSTLDGWWDEAYQPEVGWAIGHREVYQDRNEQDQVEAGALYDLLEYEVARTFYDRGPDGLPRHWIDMMKSSMRTLCGFFNTHRMVGEYVSRYYLPAVKQYREFTADNFEIAKELSRWKAWVRENWSAVRVEALEHTNHDTVRVGDAFTVKARVFLGALAPKDVSVELYCGPVDAEGELVEAETTLMELMQSENGNSYIYQANTVVCQRSGQHGFTVRVLPHHPDLTTRFLPGLIAWA